MNILVHRFFIMMMHSTLHLGKVGFNYSVLWPKCSIDLHIGKVGCNYSVIWPKVSTDEVFPTSAVYSNVSLA